MIKIKTILITGAGRFIDSHLTEVLLKIDNHMVLVDNCRERKRERKNKQFMKAWLNQIEIYINNNQVNCYAEDALNEILNDITLKPFYYAEMCMEIDDFDDLKLAKQLISDNNDGKIKCIIYLIKKNY